LRPKQTFPALGQPVALSSTGVSMKKNALIAAILAFSTASAIPSPLLSLKVVTNCTFLKG